MAAHQCLRDDHANCQACGVQCRLQELMAAKPVLPVSKFVVSDQCSDIFKLQPTAQLTCTCKPTFKLLALAAMSLHDHRCLSLQDFMLPVKTARRPSAAARGLLPLQLLLEPLSAPSSAGMTPSSGLVQYWEERHAGLPAVSLLH